MRRKQSQSAAKYRFAAQGSELFRKTASDPLAPAGRQNDRRDAHFRSFGHLRWGQSTIRQLSIVSNDSGRLCEQCRAYRIAQKACALLEHV
jgi:hypothetical protein